MVMCPMISKFGTLNIEMWLVDSPVLALTCAKIYNTYIYLSIYISHVRIITYIYICMYLFIYAFIII